MIQYNTRSTFLPNIRDFLNSEYFHDMLKLLSMILRVDVSLRLVTWDDRNKS